MANAQGTLICDAWTFTQQNIGYQSWYLETYPWLKSFPPPADSLTRFYELDMQSRNLTPLLALSNCYEFVLSYFLENAPKMNDPNRFTGQTFWQRLIKDQWTGRSLIVGALDKTWNQLTNPFGIPLSIWIIGFAVIYFTKD